MWVAGVDGCPAGWLVVFRSVADRCHTARIVDSLADVFLAWDRPKIAAVDIPIGLLRISRTGGRVADRECRKVLGRYRQSSIFPPPSRATINAGSLLEACELERANSVPPKRSISKHSIYWLRFGRQMPLLLAFKARSLSVIRR
jgi:predicted RNase H-like nuclease